MQNIRDLSTFTEEELLCSLYVKEFLKENTSSEYFSYEEIISAITLKYLKKYRKCHLSDEELIEWLKTNYRYSLLNNLIENEIIKTIGITQNNFIFENIVPLLEIIVQEANESLISEINYERYEVEKQKNLTEEDFNNLVDKFLKLIDPSLEWLNIYKSSLNNGQINLVRANDSKEKQRLFKKFNLNKIAKQIESLRWNFTIIYENTPYMIVERNYNIKDFWSFIHEFIHFIEYKNNNFENYSLSLNEFSATTYEILALDFLKNEGFTSKEIEKMIHLRNSNTYQASIDIIPVFSFMKKLLISGQITQEEEIKNAESIVHLNNKLDTSMKKRIIETRPYYFDALKYSNYICDKTITSLIVNPTRIQKEYPYIMGNYLAKNMVEKIKTKELSYEDMKMLVENISIINPYQLFQLLGINLTTAEIPKKII